MDLDSLLEGANANLGGLIIAEYVSSLFSAVYGIFFSTALMSVFYQVAAFYRSTGAGFNGRVNAFMHLDSARPVADQ